MPPEPPRTLDWPECVYRWVETKRGDEWGVARLDGVDGFVRVTKNREATNSFVALLHARRLARALNRVYGYCEPRD